jgi:sporulation protein YlmC with PRC-barrel domain
MSAVGIHIDLGLRLLDDQLLDSDEHRCGRVDDIQLKGGPGSRTEVAALLVGPGAWTTRLRQPFSYVVDGLSPDHMHVIPWTEVTAVGTAVHLSSTAEEIGLETNDGRNVQWAGAPPRQTVRVSELLRSNLITASGERLGRVWDVRVERQTKLPDERVNETWRVIGLITGRGGWQERIGLSPEGDPQEGEHFVPWESVQEIGDGVVTVAAAPGSLDRG